MSNVKLLLFGTVIGLGVFGGTHVNAEDLPTKEKTPVSVHGEQGVKATIKAGGIAGGIVNDKIEDVDHGLVVNDIDLGDIKIGENIEALLKKKMVTVRDWSGGDGWHLTAKHKDSNRNTSLQLGVEVDEGKPVQLNDKEAPVTEGESLLEPTVKDGKYLSEWGTHPKSGNFNNVIEWNLNKKVAKSE